MHINDTLLMLSGNRSSVSAILDHFSVQVRGCSQIYLKFTGQQSDVILILEMYLGNIQSVGADLFRDGKYGIKVTAVHRNLLSEHDLMERDARHHRNPGKPVSPALLCNASESK